MNASPHNTDIDDDPFTPFLRAVVAFSLIGLCYGSCFKWVELPSALAWFVFSVTGGYFFIVWFLCRSEKAFEKRINRMS